ncbi:nitronate monooxygenase [Corynebacterium felinum]|uniref:Propionate 3-nitronate monooxygenase n=1 Tax=Corynebacterium felinum TaxID=131318 RepID=A0ABU2B931_9CORY|nr:MULTISPECIES: nitronate monooxygenase [Corynebacterium]MDF5821043.1 nitronate monooxygenase [Corynebacterium felinum]MDO4760980.1 nitronate monooxygenase [Corynebacterium sp.]MDR7355127.1 nitronate monooxygenase [Corynebacterium felinum]WJY94478.1 imidazole glycerol phosphate synthase subunit HisF [Corynebacterium felinum]
MSVLNSLRVPIIAAPMAGGPTTPELVNAVAAAGGLGFLAAGTASAKRLKKEMAKVSGTFGVNLFYPQDTKPKKSDVFDVYDALCAGCDKYNMAYPFVPPTADYSFDFEQKFAAVLDAQPAVVSLSFGCIEPEKVKQCHARGIEVWVNVTSVAEAKLASKAGVDVLVVQGCEAGGHRLTWDPKKTPNELRTRELVKKVSKQVRLPLVASGGVRSPEDVKEFLDIKRVKAVQTGSMFLRAKEAGTSKHNRRLIKSGGNTVSTRAFSGRYARGMETWWSKHHDDLPFSYPQLGTMMKGLAESKEFAYCLVGENTKPIRSKKAKKIIEYLAQ